MNSIVDLFPQILGFARQYGLPPTKKRGILREYVQTKILEIMYRQPQSAGIYFIGGTSLRLLCGLDRFSEDLDFNTDHITVKSLMTLMTVVEKELYREHIPLTVYSNRTKEKQYFEFRFPGLLSALALSGGTGEKLMIKFDFEQALKGEKRETMLFNRYGLISRVVTIPQNMILVQKLNAYLHRVQTQPRDIYDIVWLIGQGAIVDQVYAKLNGLSDRFLLDALEKYHREKSKLPGYKKKLLPFLINEAHINMLDYFPDLISKFSSTMG